MNYAAFLDQKRIRVKPAGFDPAVVNGKLFPFQRDIVRWACRLGKAAIFADCGLGKTPMQLEWARLVAERTGGRVLVLAPLAVATQTLGEAAKFGIDAQYCRAQTAAKGIIVTNYEMLHAFDPESFAGVVLDESSILELKRSYYDLACKNLGHAASERDKERLL